MPPKFAVLVDLSGTLHVEDEPTPNAVAALEKLLKHEEIAVKFVTNTTKESTRILMERLARCGFKNLQKSQFFTSLSAARQLIDQRKLKPLLMVDDAAMEEFSGIVQNGEMNSVLIALSPGHFNYHHMNTAFRLLLREDTELIAVHKGRYYRRRDGLALGPGPFIEALEFSSGKKAHLVGKPSKDFYNSAVDAIRKETGVKFESTNIWMIGDDVRDDINGAVDAGLHAILVKTGKFRETDLNELPKGALVAENFEKAVELLLEACKLQ
ncbi:unnamed protein product [Bursaphelenchus xylophilus]|uniref:Haloacid dehalogenase-like hydrolase domain-containing protein 2 n=1 Tax=Bursaphelenchus xylophilus TaxID=6326 RepID=A0A1I7S0R5_BURXY|nr:unnamed protein product [Bursaphelenchus xylophilus]CAG9088298.1 unnamed protein product [Bursaphelenchus xylophilus]